MTSKEILAVIKGAFVSMNKDCEEQFNQIEHDLEVLEHLKVLFNGFKVLKKNGVKYKDIYKDMYLSCKKVMMI